MACIRRIAPARNIRRHHVQVMPAETDTQGGGGGGGGAIGMLASLAGGGGAAQVP